MVTLEINARMTPKLATVLESVGPVWRQQLYSVGANALANEVKRHIRREAPRRHNTAYRLGGMPTNLLQKGANRVTVWHATDQGASVLVPIPGITRAFRDLTITPKEAQTLTIPIAGAAYGHRVRELTRMGWKVFRIPAKGAKAITAPGEHPRKYDQYKDLLAGTHGGKDVTFLYALKKQVVVRKDRTLLPSDEKVTEVINRAIARTIKRELERMAS